MAEATIGVIGGTGLYRIEGLQDAEEAYPDTPFGKPSDAIVTGTLSTASASLSCRGTAGDTD